MTSSDRLGHEPAPSPWFLTAVREALRSLGGAASMQEVVDELRGAGDPVTVEQVWTALAELERERVVSFELPDPSASGREDGGYQLAARWCLKESRSKKRRW